VVWWDQLIAAADSTGRLPRWPPWLASLAALTGPASLAASLATGGPHSPLVCGVVCSDVCGDICSNVCGVVWGVIWCHSVSTTIWCKVMFGYLSLFVS